IKLLNSLNPSAKLPHWKKLSGPLLRHEVVQSEAEVKLQNVSALATVQCDGWKDISKFNLIAFMFTTMHKAHITHAHNVSSEWKNAKHLKSLILTEFENLEKEYCLDIIGLCTDASGESQAARLRILPDMPWLLVADCWVHQVFYLLTNGASLYVIFAS
ncbi:hypothetical protein M422DRAFT_164447, partial [Sphaerobolus stellatus SS14]